MRLRSTRNAACEALGMGVPAALAPTGVSVSHPKERLDEHALGRYPATGKKDAHIAAKPDGYERR